MGKNGEDRIDREELLEETPKEEKKEERDLIEELKRTIEEKEREISELKEKMLYLQADFENFKKLKQKEKQETIRFANETLIKELLPVIDNLERALDHASKSEDKSGIVEGIKLTLNEFLRVLEKAGVRRIECLGQKFDPNYHEAFCEEIRQDCEPGTVVCEFQKGYIFNGRLIRPAMVSVSKKPEN